MKSGIVVYLLAGMLLLFGCEYELGDNPIDIEKPDGEIEMGGMLTSENAGDKIIVSDEGTLIRFNMTASGRKIVSCTFAFGDKKWEFFDANGEFFISEDDLSDGSYELVCEIKALSGSGSIADQAGVEGYVGSLKWPVQVISYKEPEHSLTYKINADRYLELSWKKPDMKGLVFDNYSIYFSDHILQITDPDSLSYVVHSYVGQSASYQVNLNFKDGRSWVLGSLYLEQESPEITVDRSAADSITFRFQSKYKSVVSVYCESSWLVENSDKDMLRIPYEIFGTSDKEMSFYFKPYRPEDRQNWISVGLSQIIPVSKGIRLSPIWYASGYGYDVKENRLYGNYNNMIYSWSLPECTLHKTLEISDWNGVNTFTSSAYGNQVAAFRNDAIDLLEGRSLTKLITIHPEQSMMYIGPSAFIKEDRLLCFATGYSSGCKGFVYRTDDGSVERSFDVPKEFYDVYSAGLSVDGRYLMGQSGWTFYSLTIGEQGVSAVRTLEMQSDINGWCMDTRNPEQVYLSLDGKIGLYNCRDLSLVKSFSYPGMMVGNVDPSTGYLLLRNVDTIKIIDPQTNTVLHTEQVENWETCYLYGNVLLSRSGCALNLKDQLKR